MKDSKIILIAGGTASGKTEISLKLQESFKKNNKTSTIISIDNYYKTKKKIKEKFPNDHINWDDPKVIDWEKLLKDISLIKNGNQIKRNVYSFSNSSYIKNEFVILKPAQFIIIEGIFALYKSELRDQAFYKIFIHVNSKTRLKRRYKRDKEERYKNFDLKAFYKRWKNEIYPMHKKYIELSRKFSDLKLNNNSEYNNENKLKIDFDKITKKILKFTK